MRTLIRSTGNRSFAGKAERVRMLKTTDITALTTKEINTLECGDTVIKLTGKQKHRYVVSYKEDGVGICLTYADASIVETVSYDCVEGTWTYNSTDVGHLS